jgi:hypothetical protein
MPRDELGEKVSKFGIFLWITPGLSFITFSAVSPGRVPPRNPTMRKSSPRIIAGILMLALFASVGLMTARAFSVNSVAPAGEATVAVQQADGTWNQVARVPSTFKP